MGGRLFIHIGPPKTATTSLQYAFEKMENNNFLYLGTFQPRERNKDSASSIIYSYIKGYIDKKSKLVEELVEMLSTELNKGINVIISEEMVTLHSNNSTIEHNLKCLYNLTSAFPTTIIFTIRDPIDAVPSLYQEIYKSISIDMKISFNKFCYSKYIKCYDYNYIYMYLYEIGFADIKIIDFNKIKSGTISLDNIFGLEKYTGEFIKLDFHNKGKTSGSPIERDIPNLTLKSFGQVSWIKLALDRANLRQSRIYRWLTGLLDRIPLRNGGYRTLTIPVDVAERLATSYETVRARLDVQDISRNVGVS